MNTQKYHINMKQSTSQFHKISFHISTSLACNAEKTVQLKITKKNEHGYFYIYIYICSITLIDKTDGSDSTRREEYWRKVLKTVAPYGLNTLS